MSISSYQQSGEFIREVEAKEIRVSSLRLLIRAPEGDEKLDEYSVSV